MKEDEGHFGYPIFDGMPELTTENHPREWWWPTIYAGVLLGLMACEAIGYTFI